MIKFFDLLKKPQATAAELREAVASLSVAKAEAVVSELEARRRAELLAGDYATVDELESEIRVANREVERVAASIEELSGRIADAEKREAVAELDRIEAEQIDQWRVIKTEYLSLHSQCEKLAADLRRIQEIDAQFAANNRLLASAGRSTGKVAHPISQLAISDQPSGRAPSINDFVLPGYFAHVDPNSGFGGGAGRRVNFGALKNIEL